MNSNLIAQAHQHITRGPLVTGIGVAVTLTLMSAADARASTYRVYTASAASSMTLNNDGVCSLAEAVQHANGNTAYNCTDFDPTSGEQRIELLESPGMPYSTNHFKINSTLTLSRQGVRIHIFGAGAFIDSTASNSAFKILFKSIGFFERVTLSNTAGSAGGRLIENYGELQLYGTAISNGNVTGAQNPSGRGGCIFNGNTSNGLFPAVISFAENSVISGCKAKKGGGLYNDAGIVRDLGITLSSNTATQAGGAIYNISTNPGGTTDLTNGWVKTFSATIQGNSARAGGGIFNRGVVELYDGSTVTGNFTTATGSSGESCTGSTSCDGMGGGVLSVHVPSGSETRFELDSSTLSNNTASERGGAIYSVGVLELAGNAINGNRAKDGAALYITSPTDGAQQYCNVYGDGNHGVSTLNSNTVSVAGGYSIVSGAPNASYACTFQGLPAPGQQTFLTATGNSSPNYCNSAAVHDDNFCPQPCGALNQACCANATCNGNLSCIVPDGSNRARCRL